MLAVLLSLWWTGLGLAEGRAAVAAIVTVLGVTTVGEFVRRRFQFSLRALLIAFAVVALLCGLLAQRLLEARKQRDVVSEIRQLGGSALYAYESETGDGWFRTEGRTLLPIWLRDVCGDDLFARVWCVSLFGSQAQDADLAAIAVGLGQLDDLHLNQSDITDAGLQHLAGHAHLQGISLDGHQATKVGYEHLARLPKLESIILAGPQVTDASLEGLDQVPGLRRLTIRDARITDAGLRRLRSLDGLECLNVIRCKAVTAPGLDALREEMPDCEMERWP